MKFSNGEPQAKLDYPYIIEHSMINLASEIGFSKLQRASRIKWQWVVAISLQVVAVLKLVEISSGEVQGRTIFVIKVRLNEWKMSQMTRAFFSVECSEKSSGKGYEELFCLTEKWPQPATVLDFRGGGDGVSSCIAGDLKCPDKMELFLFQALRMRGLVRNS